MTGEEKIKVLKIPNKDVSSGFTQLLSSQQKEPFSVIGSRQVHHCLPESIRATDTCILHCHHRHCICSYHKFSTLGTVTRKNELHLPVIRRTPQEKKSRLCAN